MKKFSLALVVILLGGNTAQWLVLSRLRHENHVFRNTQEHLEQAHAALEKERQAAKQAELETQSLRNEVARLRGELDRARRERSASEHTDATLRTEPRRVEAPNVSPGRFSRTEPFILMPTDIDPASIVISVSPVDETTLLRVRLLGKSSEEIETLRLGPGDIIINGKVVAHGAFGSAQFRENGTNVGLAWIFKNRAEAESVATFFRSGDKK